MLLRPLRSLYRAVFRRAAFDRDMREEMTAHLEQAVERLGARPRQVITMFFTSGVRLSMLGVVLGLPLSVVALYFFASSFSGTVPIDMPLVGATIAVVVIAVASLASWIPARKAATVDPILTLKTD